MELSNLELLNLTQMIDSVILELFSVLMEPEQQSTKEISIKELKLLFLISWSMMNSSEWTKQELMDQELNYSIERELNLEKFQVYLWLTSLLEVKKCYSE